MELPEKLLRLGIKRGSILLSNSFEDIDHAKFFAVIGVYQDMLAGFFFINSNIHPIIMSKPVLLEMQFLLLKENYSFLRYNSFLGANEIQVRTIDRLVNSMKNRQTSIVGELTESDLNNVLDACRRSDLFSEKEKRQFFY
ncbi:MAG: hypothetical protein J1E63_02490 [Muribaculaceae bacterium]|nr:hypothetical protein [Muribaculaceae bacterium]